MSHSNAITRTLVVGPFQCNCRLIVCPRTGSAAVIDPGDAAMIRGFLINKFRGDPALFTDGYEEIARRSGWPGWWTPSWAAGA